MNARHDFNKFKIFLSCVVLVGLISVFSDVHSLRHFISNERIKYVMNTLASNMTDVAYKELNQIRENSVKPESLNQMNSKSRESLITSNDIFKVEMKSDLMKLINPITPSFALTINGSYLLESKHRCSSVLNLTILLMVLSSPKNFQRRNVIRETWANCSLYSSYGTVKVLFLLGTINDSEVQMSILTEFRKHGDILQGSFIDSYQNLSHKSVMGYKWANERCRNTRYVIKTDDDLVLNMFRILQNDVHMLSVHQYHVHCLLHTKSPIIRRKSSKFYIEKNQFRGLKVYPSYCDGRYVMIINDIVPNLYKAAVHTPLFWIDDVFMYGFVMKNIPALTFRSLKNTDYKQYTNRTLINCRSRKRCCYLYHGITESYQMRLLWSTILKQYI